MLGQVFRQFERVGDFGSSDHSYQLMERVLDDVLEGFRVDTEYLGDPCPKAIA